MKKFFSIILFLITFSQLHSQVPFNQNPNWISTDVISVSTGGAFADIDKDGWPDFVVANGNDIYRQQLVVYFNNGDGTFPTTPNWQSADIDYHGHLDVGDVNGDGWPDVAVSVYIGPSGFGSPGKVKLYLNNAGTLSSNPDWVSGDMVYTFSCSFGDADGDGDLDLAVAGGESYQNNPEQPRIYYNIGGTLESLPSWKATASQYSYDVNWADFDNDGDLDLVFAGESTPNRIFENVNGTISLTPIWQSTDASQYANSLFVGDVNNDGYLDLAISDNSQLGGSGRFKIYLNNNGTMSTTPFWTSTFSGYGSGINLADIDNDNDLDLITGGWWQPVRIYLNSGGTFTTTPQYTSTSTSVVEVIVMGDVDKDAVQDVQEIFISDGTRKLFYMPRTPLQELSRVIVDSDTLQYNQYCYDLENGWISLASQPDSGAAILVEASVSWDLDMGITNWDNNKGNYLFLNTSDPVFVANEENLPDDFVLHQNYPNPFNPTTNIGFRISDGGFVSLKVYDVLGNEVATLIDEYKPAGSYEVEFNASSGSSFRLVRNLGSGIYFYQLRAGKFVQTKKMILLR
ncbi:MAG TPA: FG-GAP-like repeat-containing protein [Ignavibacteriaceae bacterium]|nr:FG-GAP-like repeat-containing protein [Ignavibacteriaceae bacterium]